MTPTPPEVWLRGPVEGFPPLLMPLAHGLLQVKEDVVAAASGLSDDALWLRPGGAASVGFHVRHVGGSLDRLLTYARGERLNEAQRAAARLEGDPGGESAADVIRGAHAAIDRALEQIRTTPVDTLSEPRPVGKHGLPSSVFGLLFHAVEHAQRHAGQIITTVRIVRGAALRPGPESE